MSQSFDHVLDEEFDNYENPRRHSPCRTTSGRRESRTRRRPPAGPDDCVDTKLTSSEANVLLVVLMVGLAAGIVWLIYDQVYDSNTDRVRPWAAYPTRANKQLKKMQKPSYLKRLWRVIWPSNRTRPGWYLNYQQGDGCSDCCSNRKTVC
ncbi:unnamed protein product [Aphis gossypii]|uniref:Uncharacterized protein n=1 Tax=Aphis gossypii TaxID=80765 RepID=A0A9P0JE33_APHGO|nr:unnamed protein product [Aphis gossypii]